MSWWSDWAPAIGTAVGGAFGAQQQNQYSDQALGLQRDSYNEALKLLQGGNLGFNPARAQGVGPSAMSGVQPDSASQLAEQEALGRLNQASKEGYNEIDRAAINAMLAETGQAERGAREAAMRGLDPGSGAAIAARMNAQQGAANRMSQQQMDVAALSRKRALDALGAFGNLSSRMRQEGFSEAAERAKSADAIDRFNAETSRFNAGQANAAGMANAGNRIAAAGVLRGATGDLAGGLNARGQQAFNQAAGAGGAAGNAIAAIGSDDDDDEKKAKHYGSHY